MKPGGKTELRKGRPAYRRGALPRSLYESFKQARDQREAEFVEDVLLEPGRGDGHRNRAGSA